MLDLKKKPFSGYIYLSSFKNGVPDTEPNKEFILGCNYAIRLLKEIDKNIAALFDGIKKIIQENPHISDEIYEDCFWLSDRAIDILKRLINLFNRFTKRSGTSELNIDADLRDKISAIRNNQMHLEEKLLIDELTSYFRLSYFDCDTSIEMRLDNEMPYYSMSKLNRPEEFIFKPELLIYKVVNTLNRGGNTSFGQIEVDFLLVRDCVEKIYLFLEENMNAFILEYNICCPAPSQLSITVS